MSFDKEKLKNIKLILTDVDGVLTKGEIFFDAQGNELKNWNVRDGLSFSIVRRLKDLDVGFMTGRNSKSVQLRAENLGIKYLIQGCMDKVQAYNNIKEEAGLDNSGIVYIGDDLIDIPVLRQAGFSVAPSDAAEEVKNIVDYVSAIKGGHGVFRDVLRMVLLAQNRWDGIEKVFQR